MLSGCTATASSFAEWIRPFRTVVVCALWMLVVMSAAPSYGQPGGVPSGTPGAGANGGGPLSGESPMSGAALPVVPSTPASTGTAPAPSGTPTPVGAPAPAAAIVLPEPVDPQDQQVPPFYVAPLKMSGYVEDATTARLEVLVEVRISRQDGWYEVPLKMNQAHVLSLDYEGPRTPVPADSGDRDEGLRWKFRGEGTHRLKLSLRVPLKRSPAGTQLQLSLPDTSRYFPTQLSLVVPGRQLILRKPDDTTLTQTLLKNRTTQVNATILGSRLDITWLEQQENQADVSRVQTSMTLSRELDRLQLEATQDLILDGSASEILVRLPSNFSLAGPQPIRGTAYQSHELLPEDPGIVRVVLAEASTGEIRLDWTLDAEFSEDRSDVIIDGFEIKDAKRQSGTIAVARTRGYRVMRHLSDNNENVQRASTTGVRSTAPVVATAFQFLHQPFRLHLDFQKIKPNLTCRPRWTMVLSEDRVDLRCTADVRVEAGVVDEFLLYWPGQQGVPWTIENFSPQVVDIRPKTGEKDQWVVQLREPMDGNFVLEFNFSRPLSGEELPVYLPALGVDRMLPGLLELLGAENIEPTLQFGEGEAVEPLEPGSVPLLAWGPANVNPQSRYYRVNDVMNVNGLIQEQGVLVANGQAPRLTARVTVHQREISASTVVTVSDIEATSVVVEQQIPFNVRYGRITALRFRLSQSLRGAILQGTEGTSIQCRLNGEPSLIVGEVDGWLKTEFPSPLTGRFVLSLRYRLNRESGKDLSIPIFECRDTRYVSTNVRLLRASGHRVSTIGKSWTFVGTDPDAVSWHSTQVESEFIALIEAGVSGSTSGFEVRTALTRVFFEENGRRAIVADYRLDRSPRDILLMLPSDAVAAGFHWNGVPVGNVVVSDVDQQPDWKQYRLGVGLAARDGEGWLTVRYLLQGDVVTGLVPQLNAAFPRFSSEVYVSQTALEISLPNSSYAFSYPQGLSQQLAARWMPFYERVVSPGYLADRQQFVAPQWAVNSDVGVFPENGQTFDGSTYTFLALGPIERIEFRSIGLGSLIFLGSFVTLTVACVMWSISATRNVFALAVLLFGISLASLQSPESFAVLLQPALLGLFLASVGIWVHMRSAKSIRQAEEALSHRSFDAHRTTLQRLNVDSTPVAVTEQHQAVTSDSGMRL